MKRLACVLLVLFLAVTAATPAFAFPVWSGDSNGDGTINAKDVTKTMKYLVGANVELAPEADYNGDGKINAKDVTLTMKYLVGLPVLTDSLLEAKYGVSEVSFEIPDPVTDKEVFGADFGFDPEAADNSNAFNAAAAYLRENPGTKLTLEKGKYDLGDTAVVFSGVKDCVVDGSGSVFMYDTARYFSVSGCEGLKLCNFTIDWDWDVHYLASVVKVTGVETLEKSGAKVTFEFLEDDASYALTEKWDSMIHLNPETLVMSGVQAGDFFNVNEKIEEKTLIAPNVMEVVFKYEWPAVGNVLLVRHYNYGPGAFNISSGSNGIVIEDVNIYGLPGEGVIVNSGAHHVRMTRMNIKLNPETAEKRRISTTADAIHIKETHGYYILEESEIGYCGDDCMNIHDTAGVVYEINGNELVVIAANGSPYHVGDMISFRRESDFRKIDFTAQITGVTVSGTEWTLTLDQDCEDVLAEGMIVHDDTYDSGNYIVRNCFLHENRARGLLAGSSNCLIENCRFYRIQQAAIQTCVDLGGLWTEGKGASNVIIRNNEFDNCAMLRPDEAITLFASSGYTAGGVLNGECFVNVLISGNVFRNTPGYVIRAASLRNLTIYGNVIEFPEEPITGAKNSESCRISILGQYYDDSRIFGNSWITTPVTPDNFDPFKINPSKTSKITVEYNYIKDSSK